MFVRCRDRPYRASQLLVRLGSILANATDPDEVYATVSHVIPHPDYNSTVFHNDIGLLYLTSPVSYTDTILPICLPSPNVNLDQFKVCVDTGFGRTNYLGLSHLYVIFSLLRLVECTSTTFDFRETTTFVFSTSAVVTFPKFIFPSV